MVAVGYVLMFVMIEPIGFDDFLKVFFLGGVICMNLAMICEIV